MKEEPPCIILTDDHCVVRKGLSLMLRYNFLKIDLHEAADFHQLISILKKKKADLILLDIKMPGGNSPEMIRRIRAVQEGVKILVFSVFEERHHALQYIRAGANAYLNKNEDEATIISVIRKVMDSGNYASPLLKEIIIDSTFRGDSYNIFETLSKREFEVAGLLVDGKGNTEISNHMKIHASTVSTYKKRIFEKLDIDNLAKLIELFNQYA